MVELLVFLKGDVMNNISDIQDRLEVERKNGKELAAKLVDHLIVMGASMCNMNIETDLARYQVTVMLVAEAVCEQ